MGKFTGVLLASDFDNTLLYTEEALRAGAPVPPLPERNREALAYFMAQGRAGAGRLYEIRGAGAHERSRRGVQRRGAVRL